jgi:hypothetical protein
VLEDKRVAMGGPELPQQQHERANAAAIAAIPPGPDHAWQVLLQQFGGIKAAQDADAKRRKVQHVSAAAAAASPSPTGGLDANVLQGLTQVFAKHPDYLKEINKQLMGGGQQQQLQ